MSSAYEQLMKRLGAGEVVLLDGGTGTELERRGVAMDADAWCGPVTLDHADVLEQIHADYIRAGAQIVTANTYASSRLMLQKAELGGHVAEINLAAIEAARRAIRNSGRSDVVLAGSLSHMFPITQGTAETDEGEVPSDSEMEDAFNELAVLLQQGGCDLILLEMMYDPARMGAAFEAATATGLPVWAGFAVRQGDSGNILSHEPGRDIELADILSVLDGFDVDVAGIMHSPSHVIGDAVAIVKQRHGGPYMAYPDSGHFEMPNWQFENIIRPQRLAQYAREWVGSGVQIIGGCCGISPEHIEALARMRAELRP